MLMQLFYKLGNLWDVIISGVSILNTWTATEQSIISDGQD